MSTTTNIDSVKNLFASDQKTGLYVPGIAIATSVLTVFALVYAIPGETVSSWAITTDSAPIAVAGGLEQPVIGFFQYGLASVYIPLLSVLLVLAGEIAAVIFDRFRILIALLAGAGAGSQLIVVTACRCGSGSTMSLLEHATTTGLF